MNILKSSKINKSTNRKQDRTAVYALREGERRDPHTRPPPFVGDGTGWGRVKTARAGEGEAHDCSAETSGWKTPLPVTSTDVTLGIDWISTL
ncbi:hypothetical protein E2C01_010288 [Portunus trituberculatus]|uniref:Uncharacterized protein n=1 Tax=Portunus trituberculatus TaxID=210409 RepID=A0A5B7D7Y7_PORTR|nr:hypothetical protein [Portunus trituberculatus]